MNTILRYSEIPSFLKDGEFYRALSSDDPTSEIEIPEKCFCDRDRVETPEDFTKLLKTTAFWLLDSIPVGLIAYCFNNDVMLWRNVIDEMLVLVYAKDLLFVFEDRLQISPIYNAIHIGRTEIVEYLAPNLVQTFVAMKAAASFGRIDYIHWLRDHGHPCDEKVCEVAAAKGHAECIEFLIDNGCPWNDKVLLAALHSGHHHCIEYALKKGLAWPATIAADIARTGNYELLQNVVHNNCLLTTDAVVAAAQLHIECLECLLENGCPSDSRACIEVCSGGYLNCLQLLHAYNVPWNTGCTNLAASFGQLDILQYLHTNACLWNASAPHSATITGQLSCLQFLLENGCPYETISVQIAAEGFRGQNLCVCAIWWKITVRILTSWC